MSFWALGTGDGHLSLFLTFHKLKLQNIDTLVNYEDTETVSCSPMYY